MKGQKSREATCDFLEYNSFSLNLARTMAKSTKRAASSSAQTSNISKKARKVAQPEFDQVEEVSSNFEDSEADFDDFEDLEAGGSEDEFAAMSSSGKDKGKGREMSGSENEEEAGEDSEGGLASDDEDMIGDDDEDLYANLNGGAAGMDYDDEEEEAGLSEDDHSDSQDDQSIDDDDEMDTPIQPAAPEPTKAERRKAKQPKPLTPAELRALAFAELTASPISNVLATQVAATLDPVTPPAPATSPLQPLLKSVHSHFINLPKQKPISLEKLRKKGIVVPEIKGAEGKWSKMDLEWEKPRSEDVRVVGKWAWGGGLKVKGEYIVELAIAMPPVSPSFSRPDRAIIDSTLFSRTDSTSTERLPVPSIPRQIDSLPRHSRFSTSLDSWPHHFFLFSLDRYSRLLSRHPFSYS